MKLKPPKEYWKTQGLPPLIYYKTNVTIGKTLIKTLDSFKADINTQPWYRDSDTVVIYVPLFWTGSPQALLKFVTILHKIIRVQDLSTVPQNFEMTRNLVFI